MVRCECMRRWLMGGGFAFVLVGLACSSGSSPPASGQGGSGAPGGGGTTGGGGSGGGAGGQGGTCPPSQVTDLPAGINLNNECPYVGANTVGCGAGTFEYNCPDPLGFAIAARGRMRSPHVGRRHDAALVLHDGALQPLPQPRRALRLPGREPVRLQLCARRHRDRDLRREHERRLLLLLQLTTCARPHTVGWSRCERRAWAAVGGDARGRLVRRAVADAHHPHRRGSDHAAEADGVGVDERDRHSLRTDRHAGRPDELRIPLRHHRSSGMGRPARSALRVPRRSSGRRARADAIVAGPRTRVCSVSATRRRRG